MTWVLTEQDGFARIEHSSNVEILKATADSHSLKEPCTEKTRRHTYLNLDLSLSQFASSVVAASGPHTVRGDKWSAEGAGRQRGAEREHFLGLHFFHRAPVSSRLQAVARGLLRARITACAGREAGGHREGLLAVLTISFDECVTQESGDQFLDVSGCGTVQHFKHRKAILEKENRIMISREKNSLICLHCLCVAYSIQ